MAEFDLLAERQRKKENEERCAIITRGDNIYWDFRCWCNAYKNGQGKESARVFAEYIKTNNIVLNWYQRKCIAEKYFGYVFTYNHEKEDWDIEKRNDNGD